MPNENHDRVQRWVELPKPAAQVWAEIGGLTTIADWHPAIASAETVEIEGETHRHLRTTEGELMTERLVDSGPHHYSFEIVESHWPVVGYRSTLSCVAEGTGCRVFWSAIFEPLDPMADDLVAAFFEAGLRSLRDRYGA